MSIKITCISKSGGFHENPHTAIEKLGWINEQTGSSGNSTRLQIYDWILKEGGIAYVYDSYGNRAKLTTSISVNGTKFVKSISDNVTSDNLLKMPECKF